MPPGQTRVLELLTGLREVQRSWAGKLLLGMGLNDAGRALASASLAAGAAGLFLECGDAELRLAQREGSCTFGVTTLEEAIRALKNELRQRRSVTVSLGGDPAKWLYEMIARGLQPQAVAFARASEASEVESSSVLLARGSQALSGLGLLQVVAGIDLEAAVMRAFGGDWQVEVDAAGTMLERRERDRALVAGITGSGATADTAARWLRVAPSLFPRALDRAYLARRAEG